MKLPFQKKTVVAQESKQNLVDGWLGRRKFLMV